MLGQLETKHYVKINFSFPNCVVKANIAFTLLIFHIYSLNIEGRESGEHSKYNSSYQYYSPYNILPRDNS